MREFSNFSDFASHLALVSIEMEEINRHLMQKAAVAIETRAKQKIGDYQDQAGEFVAWAELADRTKDDRARQGFTEDEPLLRTGKMRDSIEHNSDAHEAHIGSNLDTAVYQELGTDKIPPRSFLGGSAFELAPHIVHMMGMGTTLHLAGEDVIGKKLLIGEG